MISVWQSKLTQGQLITKMRKDNYDEEVITTISPPIKATK